MNRQTYIFVLLLFLAGALALFVTAWVSDDAFITLRTVDNWVHGYGITWNTDERVQTFTHPLWMLLLTAVYVFIPNGYYTAIVLSLITSLAVLLIFLNDHKDDTFILVLGWAILIFSKAFVDYSTSGLENPLSHLLLLLFAIRFLRSEPPLGGRRFLTLACLAGLGTLNRMDSLLFFAPALAYEFISRHRNWKGVRTLFVGFLPFLIWELFSIFYYGFLFPNTAYAKLNTDIPRHLLIQHGLTYFQNSLSLDPITLVTIVLAIGLSIFHTGAKERMLTAGVALYLLYVLAIGGDFMSGRFFSAAIIPSTIVLLQFLKRFDPRGKFALAGVLLFMGLLPSFSYLWRPPSDLADSDLASKAIDPLTGISDERLFYFSTNGLINMDWSSGDPDHLWAELGKEYRAQGTTVEVVTAAGMVGYYAGPNVHIVDSWALCDPLLARIKNDESNPRIGHFTRRPVDGYIETLQTGQNQISNPALARYYDKLKIVISGDLWSWERLKTIWELNTGKYDDLLDIYSQSK